MDISRGAKSWHLLTATVAWVALVLQLVLVFRGGHVLDEIAPAPLGTRLIRFISYFTVLSNLLVAATTTTLAAGQTRYPTWWKVLRLNAIVCIAVTGVVHWFLLRPLLDLHSADLVADKLLHLVVPALAVIGWLAFGPRGLVDRTHLLPSLAFPIGWLVYTLIRGAIVDWYPYPFLDVNLHGYAGALAACAGVAVLFLALTWGAIALDRRLPGVRLGSGAGTERAPSAR
ncbi:Pr6Pr family membrane protein [Knoellia subterranea]|uniref:Pr6Pr family membrane protein n=1 Tax=Knoellia subterranea TaxID=184882 RepID=UPI0012EC87D2|nr:Pr6Pr family membrane protein [Knoellia subterranea]